MATKINTTREFHLGIKTEVVVDGQKRVLNAHRSLPNAGVTFLPRKFSLVLVSRVDLAPKGPPIYDQGDKGSCTGQGWRRAFEYVELYLMRAGMSPKDTPYEFGDGKHYTEVSSRFIYRMEEQEEGTVGQDGGAQIVTGGVVLGKYGVPTAKSWPYAASDFFATPPKAVMDEAKKHIGKTSYRLMDTGHIKQCLVEGFPVVVGLSLYESFMSDEMAKTGKGKMPESNEQYQGGHCVVIVGFDDKTQEFIFANSWGTKWGMKGYFTLPQDYVKNPNLCFDPMTLRPDPKKAADVAA